MATLHRTIKKALLLSAVLALTAPSSGCKMAYWFLKDAWIAADAFVGPGVTVGDRAVVGARSSVFKDVPADEIHAGNPAKKIGVRELK